MKSILKCMFIMTAVMIVTPRTASGQQTEELFEGQVTFQYEYLLHLPDGYEMDKESEFPLILFLHGAGERGDDVQKVKVHGPPKILENQKDFPFIVVSPQCPTGERWAPYKLNALLEDIVEKYRIDQNRIYLTGLSMGGFGTWDFASNYPHWFAAVAPICGGGDVRRVRALKNIPVWTFHGMKDDVVPIERTLELVRELEKIDGDIKFTVYPEAGHNSWSQTYDNPEIWEWFMEHKKQDIE